MVFDIEKAKAFIFAVNELIQRKKDDLTELDSTLGDGDLGLTMSEGFSKSAEFAAGFTGTDIGKFFMQVGMTFAKAVPSSMGTLMASAFMKGGKEIAGKEVLTAADLSKFCVGFAEGIMERGKCKPGSRTIVDAVYPAGTAAEACVQSQNEDISAVAQAAYQAALAGLESTKEMEPTIGKALYHKDKAKGLPDQGAVVGTIVYQGLCDSLSEK